MTATVALAALMGSAWSHAGTADAERLHLRALAATCAHCHGTEGRAVEGEALARLDGLASDEILERLMAFRSGQRPATVMHQITRGYSPAQLQALATYFGSRNREQTRPTP